MQGLVRDIKGVGSVMPEYVGYLLRLTLIPGVDHGVDTVAITVHLQTEQW